MIMHGVRVEQSVSPWEYIIGCRQSQIAGDTLGEKDIARHSARANDVILPCYVSALNTSNTQNDMEMMWEAEKSKSHIMAKVHSLLKIWYSSQNRTASKKKSHAQTM